MAGQQAEDGRGIHQFNQATLLTKLNSPGIVEKLAGQFAFRLLRIDSRHDRQLMVAKLLDIVRIEADVRIDPKRFSKPISHGIAGDGVTSHIDLRETSNPPNCVASGFEDSQ